MNLRKATLKKAELMKVIQNISQYSPHPEKVKIIAVTKTFSYAAVQSAIDEKNYTIGENKIQELEQKLKNKKPPKELTIHFIGKLQSNKVKKAVRLCEYIQTVDSLKLAQKINQQAQNIFKKQKIYIQVNIGNDEKKSGFTGDNKESYHAISLLKNIKVLGLMTILPKTSKEETALLYKKMKNLQEKLKKDFFKECNELSMGMSGDYRIALEQGATNIRIGTAIYGERK